MQMADYDALAARTFDEPYDPELREAILVCADSLGQANDPRGPLITMEQALEDAEPRRALHLRRAMHAHVVEHGAALLGGVSSLLGFKRAIDIEWRAGQVFGLSIDARYLPNKAGITPGELVKTALRTPAMAGLRRLRVRVRGNEHVSPIVEMLNKRNHPLPLEEIEIGSRVWPTGVAIGGSSLTFLYPNLYYVALNDQILSLPIGSRSLSEEVGDVLLVDPPTTVFSRRILGRALLSTAWELRTAALQRITDLGPQARVFACVMTVLLQPRVLNTQLALVTALQALGPSRQRMRTLAKISSRTQYDADVRRAAGIAAAALRAVLKVP